MQASQRDIRRGTNAMHDLNNPAAPQGGVQANISGTLFTRWMRKCGAVRVDEGNPYQIVAILVESSTKSGVDTPNWHLTMMSDVRDSSVSKNFHFKIEIGKVSSHYWHYVLYRVANNQSWHWVGDRNTLITSEDTNQGGGGGGSDIMVVKSNLSLVTMQARTYGLEDKMSRKIQNRLTAQLTKWDKSGIIADEGGTWTGGTTF